MSPMLHLAKLFGQS